MKKIVSLLIVLLLLTCCSKGDTGSKKETPVAEDDPNETIDETKEQAKEEKEQPFFSVYDSSWINEPKEYIGDYSYLDISFFDGLPVLRNYCEVIDKNIVDGLAGAWVSCDELKKELPYYSINDAVNHLEGREMTVSENGYNTKDTILFEDSLFYSYWKVLKDDALIIPDIYSFGSAHDLESISISSKEYAVYLRVIGASDDKVLLQAGFKVYEYGGSHYYNAVILTDK